MPRPEWPLFVDILEAKMTFIWHKEVHAFKETIEMLSRIATSEALGASIRLLNRRRKTPRRAPMPGFCPFPPGSENGN
jgi:hypothetical protein